MFKNVIDFRDEFIIDIELMRFVVKYFVNIYNYIFR